MFRSLSLAALGVLAGCGSTYVQTFEHGGELRLSLAPVTDGEGLSVDFTMDGMSQADVDALPDVAGSQELPCPGPHISYATDTGTGEPVYGILVVCVAQADLGGSCPGPVYLTYELEGYDGSSFLAMDPIGDDTPAGDQFWIDGTIPVGDPMLGKTGSAQGTVTIDDGCMTEPVEHTLALEWDFPLNSVVKTRVPFDWDFSIY